VPVDTSWVFSMNFRENPQSTDSRSPAKDFSDQPIGFTGNGVMPNCFRAGCLQNGV
jgi:hypothetical protein